MKEKPQAVDVEMDGVELLARAHQALKVTGVELADLLGISPRTLRRWYAKRTTMGHLAALVPHLLDVDPRLAAQIHAQATRRLTRAGLPPPPPLPAPRAEPPRVVVAAPAPPSPPAPAPAPTELRIDGVVYAACAAIAVPPGDVLRALHAAFHRARELGLTVDEVERELSSRAKPPRARRA